MHLDTRKHSAHRRAAQVFFSGRGAADVNDGVLQDGPGGPAFDDIRGRHIRETAHITAVRHQRRHVPIHRDAIVADADVVEIGVVVGRGIEYETQRRLLGQHLQDREVQGIVEVALVLLQQADAPEAAVRIHVRVGVETLARGGIRQHRQVAGIGHRLREFHRRIAGAHIGDGRRRQPAGGPGFGEIAAPTEYVAEDRRPVLQAGSEDTVALQLRTQLAGGFLKSRVRLQRAGGQLLEQRQVQAAIRLREHDVESHQFGVIAVEQVGHQPRQLVPRPRPLALLAQALVIHVHDHDARIQRRRHAEPQTRVVGVILHLIQQTERHEPVHMGGKQQEQHQADGDPDQVAELQGGTPDAVAAPKCS